MDEGLTNRLTPGRTDPLGLESAEGEVSPKSGIALQALLRDCAFALGVRIWTLKLGKGEGLKSLPLELRWEHVLLSKEEIVLGQQGPASWLVHWLPPDPPR